MITQAMKTDEIVNELKKIDKYVQARMDGLGAKNMKKLKSNLIKSDDIMSVSKYVVSETKDNIVVYAMKHINHVSGKDYSTMYVIYYVKTYYGTYIMPNFTGVANHSMVGYIEFTRHSVERIRERLGKDFDTFLREDYIGKNKSYTSPVDYSLNQDENESVAHIGDAFVFVKYLDGGKKIIVTTAISDKEMYESQEKFKKMSMEKNDMIISCIEEEFKDSMGKHMNIPVKGRLAS